jgi:3-isopropylmalate dehydrogenase
VKAEDIRIDVFRENTEGLYVGMGGIFKKNTPDEIAIQEDVNTRKGVQRIIEYAFEFAVKNGRKKVCMSDKSNVLTYGHDLWQRVFKEVGAKYPQIEKTHMYVDALSMQLIKDPRAFDVIVTCNMFGDIVTDIGAQLQGGLGMAASANIHPGGAAMFEPVHGSAPKYAGKDMANPFGAILTAQLMYQHLNMNEEADLIEKAVIRAIKENKTTHDLGGNLGTRAVGNFLSQIIRASR